MEKYWAFATREEHDIVVWSAETFEIEFKLRGHRVMVDTLCFNPNESSLASGSMDGITIVWNLETRSQLLRFNHTEYSKEIKQVCFSSDGSKLLVGLVTGAVVCWNLETQQTERICKLRSTYYRVFCNISMGRVAFPLTNMDSFSGLCIFDCDSQATTALNATERFDCMCVSPLGDVFAAASRSAVMVKIWQCTEPFAQVACADHTALYENAMTIGGICFSPDGSQLSTCTKFFGYVVVWDWIAGTPLRQFCLRAAVGLSNFGPDWDTDSDWSDADDDNYEQRFASSLDFRCRAITYFSDGRRLLLALFNCFIVLDTETGEAIYVSKQFGIEGSHLGYTPQAVVLM